MIWFIVFLLIGNVIAYNGDDITYALNRDIFGGHYYYSLMFDQPWDGIEMEYGVHINLDACDIVGYLIEVYVDFPFDDIMIDVKIIYEDSYHITCDLDRIRSLSREVPIYKCDRSGEHIVNFHLESIKQKDYGLTESDLDMTYKVWKDLKECSRVKL
jgi:hypothetical protein